MNIDWNHITSLAYATLIDCGIHELPVAIKNIKCKGARIYSYQKYARLTGKSIEEITLHNELDDAFLINGLRDGLTLILYNQEVYPPRMAYTLWHEIGHIKCGHKKHGAQEEIQANFFASQAIAPNIVIKSLSQRGYAINTAFLSECFGISNEAAQKKIDYLDRHSFSHSNDYDNLVVQQFKKFIDKKYPYKKKYIDNEYYDELEKERENWYY